MINKTSSAAGRPGQTVTTPNDARIALVSDTHTNFGTEGDQPRYRDRLAKVIAAVNAADVDFVVIAGDLTEHGTDEEFAEFQRQSRGFARQVLVVPGNHDVGGKHLPQAPDQATKERILRFEDMFGPSFWRKEIAGIRIIGLNSLLMATGFEREHEQWAFLEQEFAEPTPFPTIVALHQPPFLEQTDEPGGDYWNIEPVPRARLRALLEKADVQAVLSGHIHRPLVHQKNNMLFVTTPPVSFGLPMGRQPQGWTLINVPRQGCAAITAEVRSVFD